MIDIRKENSDGLGCCGVVARGSTRLTMLWRILALTMIDEAISGIHAPNSKDNMDKFAESSSAVRMFVYI
jgi:hypothetical protein